MKRIIFILILFSNYATSQTVTAVGCGEYVIPYLRSDGTVTISSQNTITPLLRSYTGLDSIIGITGGQYHAEVWDSRGRVYKLGNQYTSVVDVPVDEFDVEFKDNFFVRGFYQCNVSIRNPDSTLWYWGISDPMNYSATEPIVKPIALIMPSGKKFKKVETAANTDFSAGITFFVALASDGTLWLYSQGSMTPTQITVGEPVVNFGLAGFYGILIETATKIYSKGVFNSQYVGCATNTTTLTDITTRWTSAGLVLPLKEIGSGFNVILLIDANDHLFGSGSDNMGDVGIGFETNNLRYPSGTNGVWGVDIAANNQFLTAPTQIKGKVKNIQSGTTIAFHHYVQDLQNNWYSWGRNKAFALGNGTSLGPYTGWGGTGAYDIYPNAKDEPAPKSRDLTGLTWTLQNFDTAAAQQPFTSAGINQYISTDTTTLYGVVFQQQYTITGYTWTKVSGTGGTITSPTSLTTGITGFTNGTYVFRLTTTNNQSLSSTDDITVVVSGLLPATSDNLRGTIYRN